MTRSVKQILLAPGLLAASLLLAGCGPLISFGDEGPADEIYSLRYEGGFPAGSSTGPVVYVDEPTMAYGLKGNRVAVSLDGGRRTTIDGVRWAAPISELLRNYVTRSLGHRSEAQMVSEGGLDINASCRLGTKVWAFEFVPGAKPEDDRVSVAFELSLVRLKNGQLLSHPTIAKSVPVDGRGDAAVMAAFNRAMAVGADDMAAWFKGELPACTED